MARKNILEYLENTAVSSPQKCAFSNGKESISFSELQRVSRFVGTALAREGFYREAVAIFMDKHPNTMSAFFGAIYAGCFYVCIDSSMPDERVRLILDNLSARVIIADKRGMARADRFGAQRIFSFDEISKTEYDISLLSEIRKKQIDTDAIYVVFTSGSTGVPKGVVAAHRSVIDYTEALCDTLGFDDNTVFGNQTPLYFDAPLKEIMPTLKLGATTYFIPKSLFSFPVRLIEYLNEYKINTICWVVSALLQISTLGAFEVCLPEYLRKVAFGSEVFPRRDYDLWREKLKDAEFFNLYGPTEATGMSCFWRASRELEDSEPIPIGEPFDNTEILLITDEGCLAEQGHEGEICIRGTCVTMGYYNNPEKTNDAFVQNPLNAAYPELIYRTGDIGRYNEHGELVFVTRRDSQIKHMGHRIELGEIDASALGCTGVQRACTLYDKENKKIILFYTGDAESAVLSLHLARCLPRYMLPAEYRHTDRIPLTDNGKIDRRKLMQMIG